MTRDLFARYGYDPDDPVPRDAAGEPIIPDKLLHDIGALPTVDRVPDRASWVTQPELTHAELAAVFCLSHGLTAAAAGTLLYRSPETVKTQSKAARYKLDARNTIHACCEAIRRGLIP